MKYQIEKPADEDLFSSGGHSHTANAMEQVILNQPDVHAIGLEGELGSGKSTVLRFLEQQLPNDIYKFITFDVEQFHCASTKASFVKHLRDKLVELFGSDGSSKSKRIKRQVIKAADRALGHDLTYTKRVNSNISWYTVAFAISLLLSVRYAKDSLEYIFFTLSIFFTDPSQYSLGLDETITTSLGISPILVILLMLFKRRQEKDKPDNERLVPNIGDIFKRNSVDKITEKFHVTREVGPSELKEAFQTMVSSIPDEQNVVLVIDNLDRVDKEKVREVWSDLEIFTSCENSNLRVIVPFSEKHVATALSDDKNSDGSEFILKRLPVKFRTPPVVSAGWRGPFEHYWNETLQDEAGIELCSELIDIWVSPIKQITPRFLKTHINEIAVALASNPEKISAVACSAYLLVQKSETVSFIDLIATNADIGDQNEEQSIVLTRKVLRKIFTDQKWSEQIMSIHFQTSTDIARSELLEDPLRRAVATYDAHEVVELSEIYGFDVAFQRLISISDPYELVKLASESDENEPKHEGWLSKWLPSINSYLEQYKDVTSTYDPQLIEAYSHLISRGIKLSTARLATEHTALSKELYKDGSKKSEKEDILSKLHSIETVSDKKLTLRKVSNPSIAFFLEYLWPKKDNFPHWDISGSILGSLSLKSLFKSISELEFSESNDLIMHAAKHFSVGLVKFSSRPFSDYSYSDADYPQVLHTSDFANTNTTIELFEMIPERKESEFFNYWSAITLVSAIASDSLERQYGNSTIIESLLDDYYDEEEQGDLFLDDILVFVPRYQQLITALQNDKLPEKVKQRIALLIANGRVNALKISDMFEKYYPILRAYFNESDIEQTLDKLLGWKKYHSDSDISTWAHESILDCLTYNETWNDIVISWFDSEENDIKFWKNQFLSCPAALKAISDWYRLNNKTIKYSSSLTSALIEEYRSFDANSSSSEMFDALLPLLPTSSLGRLKRALSSLIKEEQVDASEKYYIIEQLGKHICLPDFESEASMSTIISLIENTTSQSTVNWFSEQIDELNQISWSEAKRINLSQAVKNLTEQFEVGSLTQLIIEEEDDISLPNEETT
ncbi:hypothetical protein QNE36_003825 [Vibrio parahaemolyticus]|nr:hypothetical protein [Vibrio parahaemolyticus]